MSTINQEFVRLATNQERPLIRVQWDMKLITVPAAPAKVAMSNSDLQSATSLMVDSFQVVVPSTAANSAWMGNRDVAVNFGMECRAGIPFEWSIKQERQLYELQKPYNLVNCLGEIEIPFQVWNISDIYFTASAPVNITVFLFYAVFI